LLRTFIPDRISYMQIRSITCFIDPSYPFNQKILKAAGAFLQVARPVFTRSGYAVQSMRLATVPFPELSARLKSGRLAELAYQLEQAAANLGYDYVSLGPARPDQIDQYGLIPESLSATQNVFFAGSLTYPAGEISLGAVHQCAAVIQHASTISPDGFANLRFAALANVPPGSPFFPAAYHHGGAPAFALAIEAADLALVAFSQPDDLETARRNLIKVISEHGHRLSRIADEVARATRVQFGGIDFSLAPFPTEERSLGAAMQRLGVPVLGFHGSLTAAALLADTLDQAEFPRAGFSGLFLPVLEDAVLARYGGLGSLGVKDLLLYSAVCGTGLDTIPLPGDASIEQLSAILLDLASLSSRLAKPLTARLMPIPGKKAGEPTSFDFAYFANTRVLDLQASPLENFLASEETFTLKPRPHG
jgi:uncharacterized protein (UPF0210 family)